MRCQAVTDGTSGGGMPEQPSAISRCVAELIASADHSQLTMRGVREHLRDQHDIHADRDYDKVRPSDDPADIEAPHTVFPLWRAMDKVHVAPEGVTPPKMGTELPETDDERKDRRAGKSPDPVYNTTDTYTFSFHNPYTDFTK